MTIKYQKKYRIPTTRAPWWDYARNAAYFVTICTRNREHFFGNIYDGKMHLSEIGNFAHSCWEQIPDHFPFVKLGAFVVMPNHIHGIIVIDKPGCIHDINPVETQDLASLLPSNTGTQTNTGIQTNTGKSSNTGIRNNKFGPQSRNLGSIIRGYKTGVTKQAKQVDKNFKWQPRYYDHIIRDEGSYNNISEYIFNNPKNWDNDDYCD